MDSAICPNGTHPIAPSRASTCSAHTWIAQPTKPSSAPPTARSAAWCIRAMLAGSTLGRESVGFFSNQVGRVVKAPDLSSGPRMGSWVQSPHLVFFSFLYCNLLLPLQSLNEIQFEYTLCSLGLLVTNVQKTFRLVDFLIYYIVIITCLQF